mgnify:CR=1 FL=1
MVRGFAKCGVRPVGRLEQCWVRMPMRFIKTIFISIQRVTATDHFVDKAEAYGQADGFVERCRVSDADILLFSAFAAHHKAMAQSYRPKCC